MAGAYVPDVVGGPRLAGGPALGEAVRRVGTFCRRWDVRRDLRVVRSPLPESVEDDEILPRWWGRRGAFCALVGGCRS